jgi:hypothetical protein
MDMRCANYIRGCHAFAAPAAVQAASARSTAPPEEPAAASTSDISPSQAVDVFEARKAVRQRWDFLTLARSLILFSHLPFAPHPVRREQMSYQVSAIAASSGVVTLAVVATYLRFAYHHDEDIPLEEMVGTLALVAGGVVSLDGGPSGDASQMA